MRKTLILWIVLIVMFCAVYNVFTAPPQDGTALIARTQETSSRWFLTPIAAGLGLFFTFAFSRLAGRVDRDLNAAEYALSTGQLDDAFDRLRRLASKKGMFRAHAMFLLGRCAEARGDFEDAEAVYGATSAMITTKQQAPALSAHLTSLIDARRAFALIAAGRLDDGDAMLREPVNPNAHPSARGLRIRAEALLLARRGDHAGVHALLEREAATLESDVTVPDRTLLSVLDAAGRAESRSRLTMNLSPDERQWILRAAPHAAELLEAA